MHAITKVLLLAVMVCVSIALRPPTGQRCLCRRVRDRIYRSKSSTVQDVQILPPSPICEKLEIIITFNNGLQYCLNPSMKKVQNLLATLRKRPSPPPTPRPSELYSFKSSPASADK